MPNVIESSDGAAGIGTAYSLSAGQTGQGTIGWSGDRDWYRVDLVAGQTYTFAMTGTGVSNVRDPYLRLYGPGGASVLGQDDNSLPGSNSLFSYTAATTGTYFIEAGAQSGGTGQYGVAFTSGSRASFDLQMSAGVVDSDVSWSATPGSGTTVTVGFRATSDGEEPNFSRFSSAQIAATLQVLQLYSEVSGLQFDVVNSGGYTDTATILLSNYNNADGSGGYAYYPGSTATGSLAGNIYINLAGGSSTTSLPYGSYSFFTLLHEMGHAVGLSHPGSYNAAPGTSITYQGNAQFRQDTHQYSVMSYFDEAYTAGASFDHPDTLMLADIYAVQQIYGANYSTRNTDTIYGFGSNAEAVFDFALNTNPALCIWDGGGTDSLNASEFGHNQVFDLNPGSFCDIGGLIGNVSIALGVTLENAIGGSGADRFYLTSVNTANLIDGGSGTDTVHVPYAYSSGYTLSGSAGDLTIEGSAGSDTLRNIELVIFADGRQVGTSEIFQESDSSRPSAALVMHNGSALKIGTMLHGTLSYADAGGFGPEWDLVGLGHADDDTGLDFLIRSAGSGEIRLGAAAFGASTRVVGAVGSEWSFLGCADYTRDGRADLLMRNSSGALEIASVSGTGQLNYTNIGAVGPEWMFGRLNASGELTNPNGLTGDFLGNGRVGFVMYSSGSHDLTVVEVVNGRAVYTAIGQVGTEWQLLASGNFVGDEHDDFLIYNIGNHTIQAVSAVGGTAVFTSVGIIGSEWEFVGSGDFDGDGRDGALIHRVAADGNGWLQELEVLNGQATYTTIGAVGPEWDLVA